MGKLKAMKSFIDCKKQVFFNENFWCRIYFFKKNRWI